MSDEQPRVYLLGQVYPYIDNFHKISLSREELDKIVLSLRFADWRYAEISSKLQALIDVPLIRRKADNVNDKQIKELADKLAPLPNHEKILCAICFGFICAVVIGISWMMWSGM